MNTFFLQQAGWIGTPEIVLIVLAIVLLFGGRKIPELMRGIGKGVKEFKEGINEEPADKGEKPENTSGKKK
ncbi:Twin-arginine translocation protein TatA [hydrothermal vent metagenome]|uniref:Twin-arginine translocation protein TatA n=1 Tax=hydrothermal vent metagenome TaxID=652676 RepID=A0A3B0V1N6_9ZZZZ